VTYSESADVSDDVAPDRTAPSLDAFLREFLGEWPDLDGLSIVGSDKRTEPGWDGAIRRVVGVGNPSRSVISVPPDLVTAVRAAVPTWDSIPSQLPASVGQPTARTFFGKFRWTTEPTDLADAGEWVPVTDPRVPAWLLPFGGDVLITFIDGAYAAGVGIKRHNPAGLELSVGTEEAYRGRGLASRLIAQAARWVLAQGAVPIYLHDPANTASDRTARAAGFPDLGWQILGLWSGE
jgi:GNAT superfamily N-acetyltransferase